MYCVVWPDLSRTVVSMITNVGSIFVPTHIDDGAISVNARPVLYCAMSFRKHVQQRLRRRYRVPYMLRVTQ